MSLQLIVGGSGSGKTTFLYDRIIEASLAHPEQLYFIIVPEQFTMQTQKDIVTRHPRHGTMNIDIVSFQRLAYRIFEELGVKQLQVLDDMGKSLVLRRALDGCKRELSLYGGQLGRAGFIGRLKTTLSEFYQYGVTPEVLRAMAPEAKNPLLKQKLQEFSVIFQSFREYIEGHYITTEEILDVLCRVLPESELIRRSVIALDGYVGFMPVQYRLIGLFLRYAKQVAVTVTADPAVPLQKPLPVQDLFSMSSRMAVRLRRAAEESGAEVLKDIVIPDAAFRAPELAFLEKHLFRYQAAAYRGPETVKKQESGIVLTQAVNPADEVTAVVHRIQECVKRDGLRYRDIAVVTGDLPGYGKEIVHQFEQNGIPCFLDDRRSILDNPLAELIRAALETVQRDFSCESVFRCLRAFPSADRDDTAMLDRMENYVLALGIRGNRGWRRAWERTYRGGANLNLAELNAFKDRAAAPLLALYDRFRGRDLSSASGGETDRGQEPEAADESSGKAGEEPEAADLSTVRTDENPADVPLETGAKRTRKLTVREMTEALTAFLEETGAKERLEACRAAFAASGELRLAKEYGQVWDAVTELLSRLLELLGDETVLRAEYAELLDAGFSEISVGVIPAAVDRVVVGDLLRTRLAHIRVLFFVGVNDGIVPAKKEGGSLLTDQERLFFAEHELELAPTAREDGFQQRFFLYRVMTKPTDRLFVSWSGVGADGKSRRPSFLAGELRKLFPDVPVEERQEAAGETEIYTREEARRALIRGLREFRGHETEEAAGAAQENGDPERLRFLELYRFFARSAEGKKELEQLLDAAYYAYTDRGIGKAAAKLLYGSQINGSVTRLERFAECAYAHFLQYGLELTEREHYEIRATDVGNLFHESIDRCFKRVKEEGRDWKTVTDEEREALVTQTVEQVAAEYGASVFGDSARNAFLAKRLLKITRRTVWALQQQIKKGDFVPVGFEVSFSAADHLDALRISLSEDEEICLRGRIDRLDLCEDEQHVYVKIIDYKSGSTSFDLLALYYGLQLQLVVYMDAVLEMTKRTAGGKEVVPAGIFYYNISDPVTEKQPALLDQDGNPDREAIDRELLRALKMNGLVNSELSVIRHLDNSIEKESDVIPVVLSDERVAEGKSSVADGERFERLRKYVHEKVREAGRRILDGENRVAPYKSGNRTACDYCPYHAVCGFDRKTGGYDYRRLRKKKTEEIWEELCQ